MASGIREKRKTNCRRLAGFNFPFDTFQAGKNGAKKRRFGQKGWGRRATQHVLMAISPRSYGHKSMEFRANLYTQNGRKDGKTALFLLCPDGIPVY